MTRVVLAALILAAALTVPAPAWVPTNWTSAHRGRPAIHTRRGTGRRRLRALTAREQATAFTRAVAPAVGVIVAGFATGLLIGAMIATVAQGVTS